MGQLTVRKVDDEIIRRLKIRAAEHGRSAEAEHREILKQALLPEAAAEDFWALARSAARRNRSEMPGDSADIIRADAGRALSLPIIVDASVALKWVLDEDDCAPGEEPCQAADLIAPDLLWSECANGLWSWVRTGDAVQARRRASASLRSDAPCRADTDRRHVGSGIDRSQSICAIPSMTASISRSRWAEECRSYHADRRFVNVVRRHAKLSGGDRAAGRNGALTAKAGRPQAARSIPGAWIMPMAMASGEAAMKDVGHWISGEVRRRHERPLWRHLQSIGR